MARVGARRHRGGSLRRVGLVLVALLLTATATGCLTGDVTVKINKSGSGVMDIEILPYDELQKRLTELNAVTLAENAIEDYDGATFKSTTTDGRIAYRAHLPFDDYHDLVDVMTNGVQVAGMNIRVFSEFALTEIDGQWRLDATPSPEMLSDALRADPSLQQLMDSEGRVALNSDLRLTIALPGRIVRTNGDQIASGTARWSLKKDLAPRITMLTEPKPLLTFVQKVLLGAGLAIVLGIMLNLWGSRTAWQSGRTERRERKRAKKLTFGPKRGASAGAGWDNSGPIAPAIEGTVPDSGPMPPRSIPTLRDSTAVASATDIVTPPISNLPPVAPPVAPSVDPQVVDPFAPHRPDQQVGGLSSADAYGNTGAPIAPPVAPTVDPNMPDPFAPHVPGAPIAPTAAGRPEPGPVADAGGVGGSGGGGGAAQMADEPTAIHFDLDDGGISPDAEPLMFDLDDDDVQPVTFDLPEGDATPQPSVAAAESPAAQPAVPPAPPPGSQAAPRDEPTTQAPGVEPTTPAPRAEPTTLEHQAFTFDGTPGWFSAEDDLAGTGPNDGPSPEPASVPDPSPGDPGSVDPGAPRASTTFMPDPAFRDATADAPDIGGDGGPGIDGGDMAGDTHEVPAAWYPDPDDPGRYRWWDGVDWTDYVSGEDS